eukprot:TRINITY_DN22614_c0_g1_i1.p1 TRINITY_DN22614_c0_g1~~TRINITY_DN22614_c0_g1_i1.p1  ORF type:complete len:478 (+),score=79.73 TRINITY_DN22614_c0_g1_i1:74-1507(+)
MSDPPPASEVPTQSGKGQKRRALIVGGGLAGLAAAWELRKQFRVTLVDAKEYFEFTSGILRAYADPAHWDSLVFMYHDMLERNYGVRFMLGEVVSIDSKARNVQVKTMFSDEGDVVPYDFCLLANGCNFNEFLSTGESPWFPVVHEQNRQGDGISRLDERFLEGRRRRILQEHDDLDKLAQKGGNVLIVGAGFMGVEWACELQHFFPGLQVTVTDFLPRCLGPLPEAAASYCEAYMQKKGIKTFYQMKYDKDNRNFWQKIELPFGADKTYILSGVKQSNYFMPPCCLSDKGPGGGGWILVNKYLQVIMKTNQLWGDGAVFAVGDCGVGSVGDAKKWEIPPVPKTGYPAEQQAVHACRNIRVLDTKWYGSNARFLGCLPVPAVCSLHGLRPTWYLWGAGIFAVSLGPTDGCVIVGAMEKKYSGRVRARGMLAVVQKELIESTKIGQCQGNHGLSSAIWHLIHHWPINVLGRGPLVNIC